MEFAWLQQILLALGLGVLIGIEREFSQSQEGQPYFAGARTFALMALLGTVSARLAQLVSPLLLFGAWLALAALVAISYFLSSRQSGHSGVTTEIAALLTFLIGVIVAYDQLLWASVLTIAVFSILSLKPSFKTVTRKLSREDIYATLKFAIVSVVILPFLPNRTFGPWQVLNPRLAWLLVVLVSAISFLGYLMLKFLRGRRSLALLGLIGGLASSTAVTVGFAQRSKSSPEWSPALAAGILLASITMFPRVLVEVAAVNRALVVPLLVPFAVMTLAGLAGLFFQRLVPGHVVESQEISVANPFSLKPALKFGLLFVVVLFLSEAALRFGGRHGIYYTALVAGLTDVDAVALSMARLGQASLDTNAAVDAITLAALANTLMKACLAACLGSRRLAARAAVGFGAVLVGGLITLLV